MYLSLVSWLSCSSLRLSACSLMLANLTACQAGEGGDIFLLKETLSCDLKVFVSKVIFFWMKTKCFLSFRSWLLGQFVKNHIFLSSNFIFFRSCFSGIYYLAFSPNFTYAVLKLKFDRESGNGFYIQIQNLQNCYRESVYPRKNSSNKHVFSAQYFQGIF